MDRSIMAGVGKFFDKPDDQNIQFGVKPVIVNCGTMDKHKRFGEMYVRFSRIKNEK